MTFSLVVSLLLAISGIGAAQSNYKPSSRTTVSQIGKQVREDSRVYYIPDDQPRNPSPNRRVHPAPIKRVPTPVPMYRQESTVGFSGEDWRTRQPGTEAQNIDIGVRGIARLEGGRQGRQCCERPEGQRWPNWIMCFFACCAGRR